MTTVKNFDRYKPNRFFLENEIKNHAQPYCYAFVFLQRNRIYCKHNDPTVIHKHWKFIDTVRSEARW